MSLAARILVSGFVVAAAFAAALAVLAASSGRGAIGAQAVPVADSATEAYTEWLGRPDDGDDSNDVPDFSVPGRVAEKRAGARVYLAVTDLGPGDGRAVPPEPAATSTLFRFSVNPASDARAIFPASRVDGGRTLSCADNRNCDLDPANDRIVVRLDVADDAADGSRVIVDLRNVLDRRTTRFEIPVIGDRLAATGISADLVRGSSASRPADGTAGNAAHEAVFRVLLEDNKSPPGGFAGERLVVTTTRGVFRSSGFGENCAYAGVKRCTLTTDANGGWIQLRGDGQPGPARLTFRAAGYTVTKDVTFYGEAHSIAAAAEQSSVAVGGSVFVVVTVTDATGNGIEGRTPTLDGAGVRGPHSRAVKVTATDRAPKDAPGEAGDIPACRDGTNADGRCVMRVTAPDPAGTANDATRGTHTITVAGASPIPAAGRKAAVEVTVVGPAARVSAEAPARVEPGASTDIAVTVVDDRGALVGAQGVEVTRVAGSGSLVAAGPSVTRDGVIVFGYRAPARAETAAFDIAVRALDADGAPAGRVLARTRIVIRVGEAGPGLPLAQLLRPLPSGTGFTITLYAGGSIAELREALLAACSGEAVTAYAYGPGGSIVPYVPNALVQAVNTRFAALFPFGLPADTGLIVARCDR